jgi:hypothetical protein
LAIFRRRCLTIGPATNTSCPYALATRDRNEAAFVQNPTGRAGKNSRVLGLTPRPFSRLRIGEF